MPPSHSKTIAKLIGLVRAQPVLYDPALPGRRDTQLVSEVWEDIALTLDVDEVDGELWRKKWRNIRDTYIKKRREQAILTSQGKTKEIRWAFYDMLTFLDKYLEPKSTNNFQLLSQSQPQSDDESEAGLENISDDDNASCTERSSILSMVNQMNDRGPRIVSLSTPLSSPGSSTLPSQNTSSKATKRSFEETIDQALKQLMDDHKKSRDNTVTITEDIDGDRAFFDSCASRMKKLPLQTKSFLKLQISQLFLNAENPDISPIPITPLPPPQNVMTGTLINVNKTESIDPSSP